MSSWAQHRQPANMATQPPQSAPLQQQQQQHQLQQPLLQPQQVGVGGSGVLGVTAHFGSQSAWPPNYNQQPMQPLQQAQPNSWAPNPIGNAYSQHNPVASSAPQSVQNNNWPQQDILPGPQPNLSTSGYFLNQESFIQPQQQQQYPSMQQSYPLSQQYQQNSQPPVEMAASAPVTTVSYSRQSTQPMDNVNVAQDYFDNKANNNNDGWGDWDWSDNGTQQQKQQLQQSQQQQVQLQPQQQQVQLQPQQQQVQLQPQQQQVQLQPQQQGNHTPQQLQPQQQLPPLQQQQHQHLQQQPPPVSFVPETVVNNSVAIEDSFRTESNDNWQLGSNKEANYQPNAVIPDDVHQNSQQPPPQEHIENVGLLPTTNLKSTTTPAAPPSQPKATILQSTLAGIQHQAVHSSPVVVKPTHLPLSDVSQTPEAAQANNIPSPVYVSQAKPVSKPPRQYASLPAVTNDVVNTIVPTTPPHAFQNRPEPQPPSSGAVALAPPITATLPPPMKSSTAAAASNPFKRAGVSQHHRAGIVATPLSAQQPNIVMPPAQFYVPPPPPPEDFANPSMENHEVIAPDNSEVLHENLEIAPNHDRNEYLQTSHLSEIGGNTDAPFNIETQEQNNESDDFPPPGLSRLVLGQPENESRQVPGTELEISLNIERQADGQDTDPSQQRLTFTPSGDGQSSALSNQIDITADRNLYLVPGESDVHEQRVVTGLENGSSAVSPVAPIQVEQREVELDGENIEDQHQPQPPMQTPQHHHSHSHHHHHHRPVSPVQTSRDEPLEGANSLDRQVQGSQHNNNETESSMTVETNAKDLSNISTGNDESDQRDRHYAKTRRGGGGGGDDNKKRKEKRYESEESEFSSDRERRRYREGSVRSERDRDRDSKERIRRDKRDREVEGDRERDGDRYRGDDRENKYRDKYYRDRESKPERGGRYASGRYDADSKYETEGSTRHERRRGGDRSERTDRADREAYEEYRRYRKYNTREDRRGGNRPEIDRRRSDRDYRDDRDPRRQKDHRDKPRNEYDEYRKTSSRNARDSDIEKESRLRDKDPRYAAHSMYSGYPGYGYDPYAAYYYEQMARTNPQAYSEWYKKYYGHAQAPESITNDGRESVHSGRSSANNEKDRYSVQHHQYIPHTNEYHRHIIQPVAMTANMSTSLNSTMIEARQQYQHQQQGSYSLNGGPSTGNLSQINQLPGGGYYPSAARSYYARSEYSEPRPDNNLSLNLVDAASSSIQQDPQRLTPHKFSNDHPVISLGPGLLVAVKPKYSHNGITNIVKIFKMGANDATNKLFQSFPGPLVRGLTHKKTIIEFCEDQIRLGPYSAINRSRQNSINSLTTAGQTNKASFTLMWNLLILLLRQNGMVVGTDIAELLMKNQQQFPYETPQSSVASSSNRRESLQSDDQGKSKENIPSDGEQEVDDLITDDRDETDETESKTSSLSEDEITEKFRNYLLYGNVNEALDWATDNNLWGHALFLASKVDRRSHANVMMKFANKLSLNDPLQTLYQLMSGRTPSSVTSVQDEKWGDWRPHLSMILSNTSQKPELDRKAITTLGDSLLHRGDLFASHFCYLMAQVGFGKYPGEQNDSMMMQNSVRLVLLGSSHHKAFEEFATNESIMMTEVYEYACSLNDDKFSLVEFQPYKFLIATRMLDYGYQLKCLMYMEQISLHIQRDPTKYEPIFINQVYELADRLKYYDPVLEKSMDEVQLDGSPTHSNGIPFEEQKWLQDLRSLAIEYMAANVQTPSQEANQDYQQTSNVIDQEFSEINRQFNELNLQYSNSGSSVQDQQQHHQPEATEVQYNSQADKNSQAPLPAIDQQQQYPQFYNPNEINLPQTVATDGNIYGNGYVPPQESYQQPQQTYDPQQQAMYDQQQAYPSYGHDEQPQQQNTFEYWGNQAQIPNDELEDKSNSKSTSVSENSDSVSSTVKSMPRTVNGPLKPSHLQNTPTLAVTKSKADIMRSPTKQQQQKQQFKSFNFKPIERNDKEKPNSVLNSKANSSISSTSGSKQQQQQPQSYLTTTDTARPTISMPNTQKPGYYDDSRPNDSATNSNGVKKTGSNATGPKSESKNQSKSGGPSSNQNSGWFGGIWNKLSLKPKNQMILPDDKNPAIVWDPEKKKWVNTDGEEESEASLKPPPKMSDIMGSTQNNSLNLQQLPPPQQLQQQPHHQQHQQPMAYEEVPQQIQQQPPQPIPSPGPIQTYSAISSSVAQLPGEPAKQPSLQSNMFKMQRNRTLKNSYVDVFNPSGAAPKSNEQVLAPALPPAAVPVGGFFIPGAAPSDGAYQQQQHQPTQEGGPQFYNPTQFGGYQQ